MVGSDSAEVEQRLGAGELVCPCGGVLERFFRTVRDQFLVEIGSGRELDDLAQLNTLFTAWVETVYHRREHSETGQTPIERWSVIAPGLPSTAQLREAFLWSEWRTVTKTAHGRAARQQLRSRRRPGRPQGRAGVRPVRPHRASRSAGSGRLDGRRGPARDRPARAPQSPPRRHRTTAAGADRDRLPAPGRAPAHRRTGRTRAVRPTARRSRARRARPRPARPLPGTGTTARDAAARCRRDRQAASPTTGSPRHRSAAALAPQMLHRHGAHAEAVARIGWCITERGLGVITGEVGAGKTVAVRAALAGLDPPGTRSSTSATPPSAAAASTAASSPPSAASPASTRPR